MRPYPYLRQEPKKKKRSFIPYFMVLVTIVSVAGIMVGNDTGTVERVKGYKFTQNGNFVDATIDGKPYQFNYFPKNLLKLHIDNEVGDRLRNTHMVYVSYPENESHYSDLAVEQYALVGSLETATNAYVAPSFSSSPKNETLLPIANCQNATFEVPVILLEKSNSTGVYLRNNCIVAEYSGSTELPVIHDLIMYGVAGILP